MKTPTLKEKISKHIKEWVDFYIVLSFISVGFLAYFITNISLGVNGFGPEQHLQITVNRLYVDGGKESSHYMVGTDQGVFEIGNFVIPIQIFNADELYSKLEVGKKYNIKTKGNKVVGFLIQEYPYIVEIY